MSVDNKLYLDFLLHLSKFKEKNDLLNTEMMTLCETYLIPLDSSYNPVQKHMQRKRLETLKERLTEALKIMTSGTPST